MIPSIPIPRVAIFFIQKAIPVVETRGRVQRKNVDMKVDGLRQCY